MEQCGRCVPPVDFAGPNAVEFKAAHDRVVHAPAREALVAYAREQTRRRDAAAAKQASQKAAETTLKPARTRKPKIEPTVRTSW